MKKTMKVSLVAVASVAAIGVGVWWWFSPAHQVPRLVRELRTANLHRPHPYFTRPAEDVIADIDRFGPEALPPLIDMLHSARGMDREDAARLLARFRDARAVTPLLASLKDSSPNVRMIAAYSLGEIGDARAVKPLIAILPDRSQDMRVRKNAASALGRLGDRRAVLPLIDVLRREPNALKPEAAMALGRIGDERALPPLIVALKQGDPRTRQGAARAIAKFDCEQSQEALLPVLKDEYDWNRREAAVGLGRMGRREAVPELIADLEDRGGPVVYSTRLESIRILGELGDVRARKPLQNVADNDRFPKAREAAREALKKLKQSRNESGQDG